MYGPGVLLIREAVLHWKKGWATVILLGCAYAIFEEGIALRTMFTNSTGQPVGNLAVYGRWLEINWVWSAGLLIIHAVFSIALPIMLFGLTFPELKSRSIVTKTWKIAALFLIILLDSFILQAIVPYKPSAGIILLTILAILGLIYAARRVPANLLQVRTMQPRKSTLVFALIGFIVLPFEILAGAIGGGANWPPADTIALEGFIVLLLILFIRRSIGAHDNERQKLALAIGLVSSIAVFGFLASLSFPIVLLVDAWMALYLRGLWRDLRAYSYEEALRLPAPQSTAG